MVRDQIDVVPIPSGRKNWQVQAGIIEPRSEESASSLELLLGCPMAWTLRYKAQMHPGSVLSVPQASELIGHLLHSCIHQLYSERKDWSAELAARRIREIFDEQICNVALPLLLPGRIVERTHIRKALADAIFDFEEMISREGFRITETELRRRKSLLTSGELVGQLDLVLQGANLNEYVVDFKWAGNLKYKRDEIKEGRHLQLAVYAILQKNELPVDAGYYMVKQKRLLSATSLQFPSEYVGSPMSLDELWNSAITTYEVESEILSKGLVCAKGVDVMHPKEEMLPLSLIPPPCKFCDFGNICGKIDYES